MDWSSLPSPHKEKEWLRQKYGATPTPGVNGISRVDYTHSTDTYTIVYVNGDAHYFDGKVLRDEIHLYEYKNGLLKEKG